MTEEFNVGGRTIKAGPNGDLVVEGYDQQLTMSDDGVNVTLKNINSVGIGNIIDVESHEISRDDTGTVHEIRFRGEGHVKFSYTKEGKIREFTGTAIALTASKEGDITLRRYRDES